MTRGALAAGLLLLAASAAAATPQSDLLAADRAFSGMTASKGQAYAWLAYGANDARLYGAGQTPLYGRGQAFRALRRPITGRLERTPETAALSEDGKTGWTDGHWRLTVRNAKFGVTGHYLTVWTKDRRGWKIRADMAATDPKPGK